MPDLPLWRPEPAEPRTLQLRDYQADALDKVRRAMAAGARSVLLSAATGSGKTEAAVGIAQAAVAKGSRVQFLADLRVLVAQTVARFEAYGLECGVLMGAESRDTHRPVVIGSQQTARSRLDSWASSLPDLVIVDEADRVHQQVLDTLKGAGVRQIGLTATPFRPGLANYYDAIVTILPTFDLIDGGHLVPLRLATAVKEIDTEGVELTTDGQFVKAGLSDKVKQIIGDIVPTWEKQVDEHFDGDPVRTVLFAPTQEDCRIIAGEFTAAGYEFRPLVADMDAGETQAEIAAFRAGDCLGLASCYKVSRGFDVPGTRIVVDAFPMRKSVSQVVQRYGRAMRPEPGKEFGLIIDHATNWARFHDIILSFWAHGVDDLLTGGEVDRQTGKEPKEKNGKPAECPSCGFVYPPLPPGAEWPKSCPSCAYKAGPADPQLQQLAGEIKTLGEITRKDVDKVDGIAAPLKLFKKLGVRKSFAQVSRYVNMVVGDDTPEGWEKRRKASYASFMRNVAEPLGWPPPRLRQCRDKAEPHHLIAHYLDRRWQQYKRRRDLR